MADKNYTTEQTNELVTAYVAAVEGKNRETLEAYNSGIEVLKHYEDEFDKSIASLRQVLVREKVYIKKPSVDKTGKKPESKEAIMGQIAKEIGKPPEVMESLTKATVFALKAIRDTLIDRGNTIKALMEPEKAEEG